MFHDDIKMEPEELSKNLPTCGIQVSWILGD
jgi:hypothetical protein